MPQLRRVIKSMANLAGLDVRWRSSIAVARAKEKHDDLIRRWRMLERYQPLAVLDIGANEGQFAALIREAIPTIRIISFEPITDCFLKVQHFLMQNGPGDALNVALGEHDSTAVLNRNEFSPSSSMLEMERLHCDEFPQTVHSSSEEVQVRRLDSIADQLHLPQRFVAKVDVQGFEDRVIRGGLNTIAQASAIVLELTSYALYKDQAIFPEVHRQLSELGFIYRGNIDQMLSSKDGRILQFDGLFENSRIDL